MDFNAYNKMIDTAILELIDIKTEISHVERGFEPPKCSPVIINPSTGSSCRPMSIDFRAGEDPSPIETAIIQWIGDFKTRLATPPGSTTEGG